MSWSKQGRIYLSGSEAPFSSEHLANGTVAWSQHLEDEFFERVRGKAAQQARDILAQAQAEAETLKQQAYQEGLAKGRREARQEKDKMHQAFSRKFDGFLAALETEKTGILDSYKQDIVAFIALAVSKIVQQELDQKRREVLHNLLCEALELVDRERDISLSVNPEDQDLVQELMDQVQLKYPRLEHWQVKSTTKIQPGGVVVETAGSQIDNTIDSLWKAVNEVLEQLAINGES